MIVLFAFAWSAVLVLLTGGRLRSLDGVRIRHEPLVLILFVLQALARGVIQDRPHIAEWTILLWGACCLALITALIHSVSVPGVLVLACGLAANLLVTLANQGMPLDDPTGSADVAGVFYRLSNQATTLRWLGDVLPDPSMTWLLSLGDMLMVVGLLVLVLHGCTSRHGDPSRTASLRFDG